MLLTRYFKRLGEIGSRCVVINVATELPGSGELKPGFEIPSSRLVQPFKHGVARVVELWVANREISHGSLTLPRFDPPSHVDEMSARRDVES